MRISDWSSDVCSSDLGAREGEGIPGGAATSLRTGKGESLVARPSQLLDAILAAGRKGLSIQRYKGLGEMNAEQLWAITLDPPNPSILKVAIEQADYTKASRSAGGRGGKSASRSGRPRGPQD